MQSTDYKERTYLSAIEASKYLDISVSELHRLVYKNIVNVERAGSGQMRFSLDELKRLKSSNKHEKPSYDDVQNFSINDTIQKIYIKNSMHMDDVPDESIHLVITSPPYFNAKMYSAEHIEGDLGNIHDLNKWLEKIEVVWTETYRVLQPGRKAFINIMNLPVRLKTGGFRTLNLVGKTIDVCEKIGFIFKRDIIWHKTNAVRAHFGTYPYPGGILINNMHEFILEFDKPMKKGFNKYGHLTQAQKEQSILDKEFWVSIKKSDVWLMKPQGSSDSREHVAPFPYELPYRLIKAFSYVGETILDPFVGSGTTMFASIDLKRNCIGYEINPDIALETVKKLKNYQLKLW